MKTASRKTPSKAIPEPEHPMEWLVVDGGKVIYRGESCGAAIGLIEKRGLKSTALWRSASYIVELLRHSASKAAMTPIEKPFRVLDDNGMMLYSSDTKADAWAFTVGRGSGKVFKLQANFKMKPVKCPPIPRSGD